MTGQNACYVLQAQTVCCTSTIQSCWRCDGNIHPEDLPQAITALHLPQTITKLLRALHLPQTITKLSEPYSYPKL